MDDSKEEAGMFKIEATADTHFPVEPEMFSGGEVLVVAGDLCMSGGLLELLPRLDAIQALPHKVKIVVAGNHDKHLDPQFAGRGHEYIEENYPDIVFLGYPFKRQVMEYKGVRFLGLPYVTNLPRWAFNREELSLEALVKELPPVDVVISHSPPKHVRDGKEVGESWGIKAWHQYINAHKPRLWICGHIHESYGEEMYEGTRVINVANCDEKYKQVNPPVVIDVEEVTGGQEEGSKESAQA